MLIHRLVLLPFVLAGLVAASIDSSPKQQDVTPLMRRDDTSPFKLKLDPKNALRRHHQRNGNHISIYKRKALNAHSGNDTCHHFANYTGYGEIQKLKQHRKEQQRKKDLDQLKLQDFVKIDDGTHLTSAVARDLPLETKHILSSASSPSGIYKLVNDYSGSTFFDRWNFYTEADPTGGMIQYLSKKEAKANGLIGLKDGNAYMKIGNGDNGIQKSVRISTKDSFTTGILVLDGIHMPTGCGVWPAFWTNPVKYSGAWPEGGEIDLVEGVHYFDRNMYSIHAPSTCTMSDKVDMLGKLAMPDKALAYNCDPHITDDQGCGVQSQRDGDFGQAYNDAGGGLHVLNWDSEIGIQAYFFHRNRIPQDLINGDPKPETWGKPKASWGAEGCKPDDYFKEHAAVFTNTVCGTWAGSAPVWKYPMGGQSFTCQQHTGKDSCYQYMLDGADLSQAYWEIASVKIYQKTRRP